MSRVRQANPNCPNSSNRFHECGNYCISGGRKSTSTAITESRTASSSSLAAGAGTGYSREMLALLVQKSPQPSQAKTTPQPRTERVTAGVIVDGKPQLKQQPRMERASTGLPVYGSPKAPTSRLAKTTSDLNHGWSAKEEDYFMVGVTADDKRIDSHVPHPTPEGDQEQAENSTCGSISRANQTITIIEEKESNNVMLKSTTEADKGSTINRPKSRQIGRAISGFLVRRTPKSKTRLIRSRTELNWNGAKEEAGSTDEGSGTDQDNSEESLFALDPSQLPPPTPMRSPNSPSLNTIPLGKQRAGWSITQACMARIREHLNKDPIDQEAIQVLLVSMEKSETDTGYTFANWRMAVAKFVAEAKRFERQNMVRLAEASIIKWEKALAEVQFSLNEDQKRITEVERAVKNQFDAREAIFLQIQEMETERESLGKKLNLKKRELECRKKDSLTNKKEHAYYRLNLEHTKQVILKKEENVRKAEAAIHTAELDARTEQDRLSAILKKFITELQGFEICQH